MRIKRVVITAFAAAFFASRTFAGGGASHVTQATEKTQLANNAELVNLMANAQQQLDLVRKNLASLSGLEDSALQLGSQFGADYYKGLSEFESLKLYSSILDLRSVLDKTSGILGAVGEMDRNFRRLFPGSATPVSARRGLNGETFNTLGDYTTYQNQQMIQSCEDILHRYGYTMSDLDAEEKVRKILQDKSRSAEGIKSAIQATNEINIDLSKRMNYVEQAVRENTAQSAMIAAKEADEQVLKKQAGDLFFAPVTTDGDMEPIDLDFSDFGKKIKQNQR